MKRQSHISLGHMTHDPRPPAHDTGGGNGSLTIPCDFLPANQGDTNGI